MRKFLTRKVLIFMLMLSMFSFLGCESRDEKAERKILSALQEKYGVEFVLDGIGGGFGTMNNNTLKGIVRPKNDETLKVPVEITKDYKTVYDKYLNQAVAKNTEPSVQNMARDIWPDSKVMVTNDTGLVYPEHTDTGMSYPQFLELYPSNTLLINVYLNAEKYVDKQGEIDKEAEVNKYFTFADQLAEKKYVSSMISIIFLTSEAYGQLEEARKSNDTVDNYFSDQEKSSGKLSVVTRVGYSLGADGSVEEPREKIMNFFKTWQEKRLKSIEQTGGA